MSDVPAFPAPDPESRRQPPSQGPSQTRPWRRRWFAFVMLVVTLAAAGALFTEGTRRAGNAAAGMVRISAGCRVPVTLRDSGDFFVYIEQGPVPMPDSANCTNAGLPMTNPHGIPMIGFAVATPDGVERRVTQVRPNRRYDLGRNDGLLTSRFTGRAGETVIVGLVADSPDVAVAIGENVFSLRLPWRIASGIVLAIGLLLTVALLRAAAKR